MSRRLIFESPQLEAVILSLRIAGPELRKQIYAQSRAAIAPEWQSDLATATSGHPFAKRVIADGARANVTTRGVTLTAAKSSKKFSGGFIPLKNFAAVEFGATRKKISILGRRGTKTYRYTRTINQPFGPRRRKGYYAYKTGDEYIFRYASLWIKTVARTLHDAVEGKL
jgi:hypothetical protein